MDGTIRYNKFISAPILKNGPNGIASERFFPLKIIRKTAYTKPKNDAKIIVVNTPSQPISAPTPPISFTSPPPMASFLNIHVPISAIANTPKNPVAAPNKAYNSFCHHIPLKLGLAHANNKPHTISPNEKRSGIIMSSKSMTDKQISAYTATNTANVHTLIPYRHTNNTVSSPVISSTTGYCNDIGFLHWRHLPKRIK